MIFSSPGRAGAKLILNLPEKSNINTAQMV
jgi:hypothetical protein